MAHLNTVATQGGGTHSYSDEEVRIAACHLNEIFGVDPELAFAYLPLSPDNHQEFFAKFQDGVLLCKLLNSIQDGIINPRHFKLEPKSIHERMQNLSLVFEACQKLGLRIVNIGPQEIIDGRAHLILALLWKITCASYLKRVSAMAHPEINNLMLPNEDHGHFQGLSAEATLMRWFNFHLANAGSPRRISNFSSDIADGECYLTLLNEICGNIDVPNILNSQNKDQRAATIAGMQQTLGLEPIVTAKNISSGDAKSNLLFVAHLFDKYPGLMNKPVIIREEADISHQLFLEAELAKALEAQKQKELQYEQQLNNLQQALDLNTMKVKEAENQMAYSTMQNQQLKDQLNNQQEDFLRQQLEFEQRLEMERREREKQRQLMEQLEREKQDKERDEWAKQELLRQEQLNLQTISDEQRRHLEEQGRQLEAERQEKLRLEQERQRMMQEQDKKFADMNAEQMRRMQEQQQYFQQQLQQQQQELEKQRLENDRMQREREDRERQEKERLRQLEEQLRNAQNDAERQRIEREKQEWERQQQQERDRLERERLEKERLEREQQLQWQQQQNQLLQTQQQQMQNQQAQYQQTIHQQQQQNHQLQQQNQQLNNQANQPNLEFMSTVVTPSPQPQPQPPMQTQYQQTNQYTTTTVHQQPPPVQHSVTTTHVVHHVPEPSPVYLNTTYEQNVATNYAYNPHLATVPVNPAPVYPATTTTTVYGVGYTEVPLTYEQRVAMNNPYGMPTGGPSATVGYGVGVVGVGYVQPNTYEQNVALNTAYGATEYSQGRTAPNWH